MVNKLAFADRVINVTQHLIPHEVAIVDEHTDLTNMQANYERLQHRDDSQLPDINFKPPVTDRIEWDEKFVN